MKKIVLDPGHGGKDPGAVGPGGTKEKDVALAVAKYLQQELSPIARISLARETDEYRDLWERSTLANSIGADYFVSIHCNAAVNRTANGTETLIYGRGGEAEKLAYKVQAKVVSTLGTRDRGIKVRPELHVLARTKMPAILVELAFISNPQEEKLLADPDRQREAARAIAQGIADYLGVRLRDNPIKEANEEVESTKVLFEGKTLEAFLKDGKTYVEVRKLCEALGLKVIWHADTKLVEVQK